MLDRLLHLHEFVEGPRLELAVERLSNGLGFVFEDVWLRRVGRRLECEAVNLLPNGQLTGLVARELIQHAQAVVERLIAGSPTFAATVETWEVRYSVIEDYGMGTAT